MKAVNYTLVPLVAAVCCVSCSSPEERAEDSIVEFAEDLEEIISDNRSESVDEIVDEIHDYITDNTPDLLDDISELTNSQKARLVEKLRKEKVFNDLDAISEDVIKAKTGKNYSDPGLLWNDLSAESKVKVVEIGTCIAKIFTALCFNDDVMSEM